MAGDDAGTDSPLRNPNFFVGPLRTLRASLSERKDISMQDIADAYAVLCSRIRTCGAALYSIPPASLHNYEALGTVRQSKTWLFAAIKRDIGLSNDDSGQVVDGAIVCHAARLFLADLFKFRNLYSVLSDEEMSELLQNVTTVGGHPEIGRKPILLSLWILSTQELPDRVLSRCKDDIAKFLARVTTGCDEMALQALQTTRHFLDKFATIFLRCFVEGLLAPVLQHIMSKSKRLQESSSDAVASFAYALLSADALASDVKGKASAIVGRFIDKNNSRRVSPRLDSVFAFTYTDSDNQHQPVSLSVAAHHIRNVVSLITISGPQIYSRPTSLKLLLNALKTAKDTFREHSIHYKRFRQRNNVGQTRDRAAEFAAMKHLADAAWRSVVWSYSQLSPGAILPSRSSSKRKMDFNVVQESAFKIVEQEFGEGMGILLVAHFLHASEDGPGGHRNIAKILRILSKLLTRSDWMATGLRLFRRLVSPLLDGPINMPKAWSDNQIVVAELFDGSLFTSEDAKEICAAISRINLNVDPFDVVPPLSEAEIAGAKWEELVTLWSEAVHQKLRDGERSMSNEIVDIWQALLLARAQLTQGNGHLSVVPERADFLSSVLTSFILASQEIRPDVEHIQSLLVARQLWSVVKNVFASGCTETMAKDILSCVLMQTFSLEDEQVKEAWNNLCIDLINGGSPRALLADPDVPSAAQPTESKKVVWKLVAEQTLAKINIPGARMALLEHSRDLLCVPIGQWDLTEDMLWVELLRSSFEIGEFEKSALTLMDAVSLAAKEALSAGNRTMGVLYGLLLILGELYTDNKLQGLPTNLFDIIRDILRDLYPPTALTVDDSQTLLALLTNLLGEGSVTRRLALLGSIKDALVPWFADRQMVLAEDAYNDMLETMYSEAINTILANNPTRELVAEFADFLASPFLRYDIPRPAVGPMSFKTFWEAVEHNLRLDNSNCPDSIKLCLYRLQEFGYTLPRWLQVVDMQSPVSVLRSPVSDIVPPSVAESPISPKFPVSFLSLKVSPIARRSPLSAVNEWMNGLSPGPARLTDIGSPMSPVSITLKRTSMLSGRPPKRQKTENNTEASSSGLGQFLPQSRLASKAPPSIKEVPEAPPSPVTPLVNRGRRFLLDVVEVQPMRSSLKRKYQSLRPDENTGDAFASPQIKTEDPSISEEYSLWETGLSSQDVTDMLDATSEVQKSAVASVYTIETPDTSMEGSNITDFLYKDGVLPSDSLSVSHDVAKRVDRSQTVPAALPSYSPSLSVGSYSGGNNPQVHAESQRPPQPLRRSATSPPPLDVLRSIRELVADDGADEMQTQVLAQTAEVAHDIAGMLRGAMAKKLAASRQASCSPEV